MSPDPRSCPLCGEPGEPDERRPAEIAGLVFESVNCGRSGALPTSASENANVMPEHLFPVRWLEAEAADADELQYFIKEFTKVVAPFEPGSAIEEAFGDTDPIRAWIEHKTGDGCVRVLIRL